MRLLLDKKKGWSRHTFEVATRIAVIKENTWSRPKIPRRDKKTSRPAVLSDGLLEGLRQLNDVATENRSRHQIKVMTPTPGNKKNEVATRVLTADN